MARGNIGRRRPSARHRIGVIAIKWQPTKEHELHLSLGTTTAQVVTAHDTFDHGREKEASRRNVIRPGSV
jgi:hypothetical protein